VFALLVFAAAAAAGCGRAHPAARHSPVRSAKSCIGAAPAFRTCLNPPAEKPHATIERMKPFGWSVVATSLKPSFDDNSWGPKVWLSPDSQTLLAEWLYACDGHLAVFVPLGGGLPRVVTGELDWRRAVASVPLGWTQGGKARIQMLRAWGPHGRRPAGVYLFDPARATRQRSTVARGC
jgi:hypothetical protein